MLVVALSVSLIGLWVGLHRPERLLLAALVSGSGLLTLLAWRRASWALAGVVTCCAVVAATHELLPGYHRRFSLRHPVLEQVARAQASTEPEAAVICYPRRWDSVSFYLKRDDVAVFTHAQRGELATALQAKPHTVLFVKTAHLHEVEDLLPAGLRLTDVASRRLGVGGRGAAGRSRPLAGRDRFAQMSNEPPMNPPMTNLPEPEASATIFSSGRAVTRRLRRGPAVFASAKTAGPRRRRLDPNTVYPGGSLCQR